MQEGDNRVKDLTKNMENMNKTNIEEAEIMNLIQTLEHKIKFLENKNTFNKTRNNEHCSYKEICYTLRSKMGSCPCELYR